MAPRRKREEHPHGEPDDALVAELVSDLWPLIEAFMNARIEAQPIIDDLAARRAAIRTALKEWRERPVTDEMVEARREWQKRAQARWPNVDSSDPCPSEWPDEEELFRHMATKHFVETILSGNTLYDPLSDIVATRDRLRACLREPVEQ